MYTRFFFTKTRKSTKGVLIAYRNRLNVSLTVRHVPVTSAHARGSLRDQGSQGGGREPVRLPPGARAGGEVRQDQAAAMRDALVRHAVEWGENNIKYINN